MKPFDFVTIGDTNFFKTIVVSAKQIARLYPGKKVTIYDWGFTSKQRDVLQQQSHVTLIPWKQKRITLGFEYVKNYVFNLSWSDIKGFHFLTNHRKEALLANKVFCLIDYVTNHGENFIFLDGDAIVINRFDEASSDSFDIGVTVRRPGEVDLKFGKCRGLNAGVVFFLGGQRVNQLFLETWKKEMLQTKEPLVEQTSLTRIVERGSSTLDIGSVQIPIDGEDVTVRILPCELYNYNWIEEGVDWNAQRILHFKSGRLHTRVWSDLSAGLVH